MTTIPMEKPPLLQKGDKVVILSTARKISEEEVKPATGLLREWGLQVVLGEHLFSEDNQFSGTTAQRRSDIQKALNDDTIKAVFCARGGYGTVKILEGLDFSLFAKSPKWIIGYSDVTVLHNYINEKLGIQTLHATMPVNFRSNSKTCLHSLKNALFERVMHYEFEGHQLNREGSADGMLIGGNLSIIYSLTGTDAQLNTKSKILFIEDLDEYLYHLDRMMMNLRRAGMLDDLIGLVVGGLSDMNDNTIPFGKSAKEIILDAVSEYTYPVCFDFPAGHMDDNRALIMGGHIKLSIGEKCSLSFY